MASKFEKLLDCSLDDYIAKKGIVSNLRSKTNESSIGFKRSLRCDDEEEEDDDILCLRDRSGMEVEESNAEFDDMPPLVKLERSSSPIPSTSNNVSIKVDSDGDGIRTFVTEERRRGITHMPSQQWRLQRENQVSKKPQGVPPLVSLKSVFDRNTEKLISALGESAKYKDDESKKRINQFNNQRNNRPFYNRNYNNNNNRNFHRNNDRRNQNTRYNRGGYGNFNNNERYQQRQQQQQQNNQSIRDLRAMITPPSSMQLQHAPVVNFSSSSFTAPQLVTFADMLKQIGQASSHQERETFADVIRNVMRTQQPQPSLSGTGLVPPPTTTALANVENLTRMNTSELMPFAAQTLLNHITTVQENFGPKYNMKVQKEIHALQGKSMLYRSGGVVSMDGPGLESNERVNPTTTDLSLNMRFS